MLGFPFLGSISLLSMVQIWCSSFLNTRDSFSTLSIVHDQLLYSVSRLASGACRIECTALRGPNFMQSWVLTLMGVASPLLFPNFIKLQPSAPGPSDSTTAGERFYHLLILSTFRFLLLGYVWKSFSMFIFFGCTLLHILTFNQGILYCI